MVTLITFSIWKPHTAQTNQSHVACRINPITLWTSILPRNTPWISSSSAQASPPLTLAITSKRTSRSGAGVYSIQIPTSVEHEIRSATLASALIPIWVLFVCHSLLGRTEAHWVKGRTYRSTFARKPARLACSTACSCAVGSRPPTSIAILGCGN